MSVRFIGLSVVAFILAACAPAPLPLATSVDDPSNPRAAAGATQIAPVLPAPLPEAGSLPNAGHDHSQHMH